jgi:hypothetical protein
MGRRLACGCCFVAALLVVGIGCKGGRRSAQHTPVSGNVTYKGQPVTGGQLTFVGDDWININAIIDENGHYEINAPVGNVKIAIDNRMMIQRGSVQKAASKGAGPRPGGPEATPLKGKYVQLPNKAYDPTTSGLTYTVTSGPQTHNIEVTD